MALRMGALDFAGGSAPRTPGIAPGMTLRKGFPAFQCNLVKSSLRFMRNQGSHLPLESCRSTCSVPRTESELPVSMF